MSKTTSKTKNKVNAQDYLRLTRLWLAFNNATQVSRAVRVGMPHQTNIPTFHSIFGIESVLSGVARGIHEKKSDTSRILRNK